MFSYIIDNYFAHSCQKITSFVQNMGEISDCNTTDGYDQLWQQVILLFSVRLLNNFPPFGDIFFFSFKLRSYYPITNLARTLKTEGMPPTANDLFGRYFSIRGANDNSTYCLFTSIRLTLGSNCGNVNVSSVNGDLLSCVYVSTCRTTKRSYEKLSVTSFFVRRGKARHNFEAGQDSIQNKTLQDGCFLREKNI